MKIHQRQIPPEGLHLEGEEPVEGLDLPTDDGLRPLGPLGYSLDLGLSSDGLWATGQLDLEVELTCVRCLERFVHEVHIPDLALEMERPATEMVDLTPLLREDILLALPAYPRCDEGGERDCPAELKPPEVADPPVSNGGPSGAALPSAWSTLDELKMPTRPT